ncbi:histamine N-methyltransferase-like [Glandiceps talaboti]
MVETIKTLFHYKDEYFQCFRTMKKYGYDHLGDQCKRDLIETFGNIDVGHVGELRVLAIGSWDGNVDEPIIDILSKRFQNIRYVVVEPDKDGVEKFKSLVESKSGVSQWMNVNFEFNIAKIENYLTNVKTMDGCLADMMHKIGQYYFDPAFPSGFVGATGIREVLQQQIPNLKMRSVYRETSLKANEMFKEESKDGNELLDFLTHIRNFRKCLPVAIQNEIFTFVREKCCFEQDGDVFYKADEEDIIIMKT